MAGPNGCGKTTAYARSDVSEFDGSVWIINPDLLTRRLQAQEGMDQPEANLAAVNRIEAWLDASIDVHQTIGVETFDSKIQTTGLEGEAAELRGPPDLCLCRHD